MIGQQARKEYVNGLAFRCGLPSGAFGTIVRDGQLLEHFETHLRERVHKPSTTSQYRKTVTHLLRWAESRRRSSNSVDREFRDGFLNLHLPSCRCGNVGSRDLNTVRAAVHRFRRFIDPSGHVFARPSGHGVSADAELEAFEVHLAEATCI